MKNYYNANKILPKHLIKEIQKYVQGSYIYIPKVERTAWGNNTGIREELNQRNEQIFNSYRSGLDVSILAEVYCLSEERVRAIIYGYVYPKGNNEVNSMENEQQLDKQQAKRVFEETVQKYGLPVQYVDVGYSASFVTSEQTLTFYFNAPKREEQQQQVNFQPMAKALGEFYKSRIQLKQVGLLKA